MMSTDSMSDLRRTVACRKHSALPDMHLSLDSILKAVGKWSEGIGKLLMFMLGDISSDQVQHGRHVVFPVRRVGAMDRGIENLVRIGSVTGVSVGEARGGGDDYTVQKEVVEEEDAEGEENGVLDAKDPDGVVEESVTPKNIINPDSDSDSAQEEEGAPV